VRIELRTVRLVAAKELLESLRDRRTLFVALLLPVLLYPLMMLALAPLVSMQKQKLHDEAQPVAMTGDGAAKFVEVAGQITTPDGKRVLDPEILKITSADDPAAALREGRIALWVEVPADFKTMLAGTGRSRVVVHRDGSSDQSLVAEKKFDDVMTKLEEAVLAVREDAAGLSRDWHKPFATERADVAPPSRRAAYLFGKMLAFILVVLTLSSSFYPAVDSVAGEKERGTMETLLVAPCGRAELVLGKFVAVLAVTLAAATLNLASMALTLGPFGGLIAPDLGAGLSITPTVVLGVLALLVPLSALFSAVSLALSTLARSVKEGQHYLTPLFLVVMPLAMVVVIPNVPLTHALAPIPVTNAVLFFRDLLLDKVDPTTTAVVMVSTFAYAALALWGCVSLFLREETLFRGPEGGTALFARPAPRERPSGAAAMFLFAACLALVWYGQSWLPKDVVQNVAATQFLIILAPCLALAAWLRTKPVATFSLRAPGAVAVIAAVAIGLAAPVLNMALQRAIGPSTTSEAMRRIGEEMSAYVLANPLRSALLFGVLPAVCEELFFRGFVLSGLTSSLRGPSAPVRAVVFTSALFAIFHIFPEKWLPTFLMGLVLGFLAVRTGSIWPGMLAHAANNAFAVLSDWPPVHDVTSKVSDATALVAAAALLVVGVAVVARRPRRQLDAPPASR
jgi:sodium transport system permease protein